MTSLPTHTVLSFGRGSYAQEFVFALLTATSSLPGGLVVAPDDGSELEGVVGGAEAEGEEEDSGVSFAAPLFVLVISLLVEVEDTGASGAGVVGEAAVSVVELRKASAVIWDEGDAASSTFTREDGCCDASLMEMPKILRGAGTLTRDGGDMYSTLVVNSKAGILPNVSNEVSLIAGVFTVLFCTHRRTTVTVASATIPRRRLD